MVEIRHILGFHMHQPPGNLELLAETNEWEARQIMLCYDRPLKYAWQYPDVARFCVGFSGILLEQLLDPQIIARYSGIVDIPAMLNSYRNTPNIEIVGMGYYHPIFPLIPQEDWDEQIERGREKVREVFGREPRIFWPPEMAFTMEMIPALARHGYESVVIDSVHVKPRTALSHEERVYRPHIAEYEGARITVVPRDRDLSNAQESGLDPGWFDGEVRRKTAAAHGPCLVTTWSDGENGGWFRQMDEGAGFWGHFFSPYMERVRSGQMPIRPTTLSEFVADNPPLSKVDVQTGAWNVGTTSGYDFSQWAGSASQRRALEEIWQLSRTYHETWKAVTGKQPEPIGHKLNRVREHILRAETSCYLFWGDSWIPKLYEQTGVARQMLDEIRGMVH
ncbi:MAG: polysaccharide deacetylase family protein [Candidatus Tectomicrobia bacterium]|uniref:Polysaccharide deacetylase family protein n=1 Tax=Tectimicrobiota bacterium TaxID=2528274 RepID=A0A932GR07_UNCTE|nr:polysaccharide deacetylase family protein [Candidatus Tectomicrobia bacterium]